MHMMRYTGHTCFYNNCLVEILTKIIGARLFFKTVLGSHGPSQFTLFISITLTSNSITLNQKSVYPLTPNQINSITFKPETLVRLPLKSTAARNPGTFAPSDLATSVQTNSSPFAPNQNPSPKP